jgi:hypothetical protein
MQIVYLILWCGSSESLPVFLAPDRMAHRVVCFIAYVYVNSSPVSLHNTTSTNEFLDWG